MAVSEASSFKMKGLNESGCFKMGADVKPTFRRWNARSVERFHWKKIQLRQVSWRDEYTHFRASMMYSSMASLAESGYEELVIWLWVGDMVMRCGACHDLNSAVIGMMRRDAPCLGLAENFLEVLLLVGHFHVRVGLRTLNLSWHARRVEVCRVAGWTNSISRQGSCW